MYIYIYTYMYVYPKGSSSGPSKIDQIYGHIYYVLLFLFTICTCVCGVRYAFIMSAEGAYGKLHINGDASFLFLMANHLFLTYLGLENVLFWRCYLHTVLVSGSQNITKV